MLKKILRHLKEPKLIIQTAMRRQCLNFLPDKTFLKLQYKLKMGKKLNLKNPATFSEKLQWLKLYDRNPLYAQLADKYGVRKYIAEKIGEQYLVPLFGVWDRFEDIDFESLPKQFVLKCTHDSGSLVICRDKSKLDIQKISEHFKRRLKYKHFYYGREWSYKGIKPRIIAEKYLEDDSGELTDYKFYCFNGEAKVIYISRDLGERINTRMNFVTIDWKKHEISRHDFAEFEQIPPKPKKFSEMLRLATIISSVSPFIRVDFYEVDEQILLSELTFTPTNGMMRLAKPEQDELLGSWLKLPNH